VTHAGLIRAVRSEEDTMRSLPLVVLVVAGLLFTSPVEAQEIQHKAGRSTPVHVLINNEMDHIRERLRNEALAPQAPTSAGPAIRWKRCTSTTTGTRILMGAAIGGAGGVIAGAIINHDHDESLVRVSTAGYVALTAIGSAIGALIGYATCR
jgi:hypothetical protein